MGRDENMIAALRRERAGYVAHGKDDRVAQVDEQLRLLGYEPEGEQEKEPQGRTSKPQQTADAGKPAAKKTTTARKTAPPSME